MKIPPARAEAFVKAPAAAVRAVLLYGPDAGLVKERADRLARGIVPDLSDPFRVADIAPAVLKSDPARLADEAAAISMIGGRRVVRLRDAGDAAAPTLRGFLGEPAGDALVVVEAGELGPRSALRQLFENADNGAAIACYADDGGGLEAVIQESLRRHGQTPEPDALAYLADHLGGDRRLTRSELEKLSLYVGGPGRISLVDATACVGDTAGMSLEDLAFAVAEGDHAELLRILDRLYHEGAQPVGILRSVVRHFQRLHLAAGTMAQGKSLDQALAALKPPVIFKLAPRFKAQVQRWPADRVATALEMLVNAEIDCKTTGLPAAEMAARALMQIARAAGKRAR